MDNTKAWYQSKTIIAGIVGVLIAVYNTAANGLSSGCGTEGQLCVILPSIPDWILGVLAAIGVYGRKTADATIK